VTGSDMTLRAALAYARIGWPVFPCRPGEKIPATAHGHLDATTDPERIASWWRSAPARNVAIATGSPGPDVLDVDVRGSGSGFAAFGRLRRAGLAGGPGVVVRTPSGGIHAYYAGTGQRNGHLAAQHIDFRSHGGYVLAPPSVVTGRAYVVVSRQASDAVLDWGRARELLDPQPAREPRSSRRAGRPCDPARLAAWVAAQREGNRNNGLFWAASRVIEAGDTDALDVLADAAQAAGLTSAEARRTIRSAQHRAERAGGQQADPDADCQPEAMT
jgi:hypothetical protein